MAANKSAQLGIVLVAVLSLWTLGDCKSAKTKPASDFFTLCSRSYPSNIGCIKKTIEDLKPKLIKGIPELRLVSLDPMNIPSMTLVEGQNNFQFEQTMTNLTIFGLGKYTVKSVDFQFDDKTISGAISVTVPVLNMTAKYAMSGKILVIPIKGEGDCTLDFVDVTTDAQISGKVVKRGGEDYGDIESVKWNIKVGGAKSHFTNLFNGDKTLGPATNRFLNDNWDEAFQTYKHLPEEAFGLVFKELMNQVYKRYPLKELYL